MHVFNGKIPLIAVCFNFILFFSPPKKCFLLCFERIPGAKHADKSVGPAKYIAVHAPDAAGLVEHYLAKAKAIDLPVWIHQGRFHGYLEQGAEGVIRSFVDDLRKIRHGFDGLLFVGYDRRAIVPLIKDREQAGRTRAAGEKWCDFQPSIEDSYHAVRL